MTGEEAGQDPQAIADAEARQQILSRLRSELDTAISQGDLSLIPPAAIKFASSDYIFTAKEHATSLAWIEDAGTQIVGAPQTLRTIAQILSQRGSGTDATHLNRAIADMFLDVIKDDDAIVTGPTPEPQQPAESPPASTPPGGVSALTWSDEALVLAGDTPTRPAEDQPPTEPSPPPATPPTTPGHSSLQWADEALVLAGNDPFAVPPKGFNADETITLLEGAPTQPTDRGLFETGISLPLEISEYPQVQPAPALQESRGPSKPVAIGIATVVTGLVVGVGAWLGGLFDGDAKPIDTAISAGAGTQLSQAATPASGIGAIATQPPRPTATPTAEPEPTAVPQQAAANNPPVQSVPSGGSALLGSGAANRLVGNGVANGTFANTVTNIDGSCPIASPSNPGQPIKVGDQVPGQAGYEVTVSNGVAILTSTDGLQGNLLDLGFDIQTADGTRRSTGAIASNGLSMTGTSVFRPSATCTLMLQMTATFDRPLVRYEQAPTVQAPPAPPIAAPAPAQPSIAQLIEAALEGPFVQALISGDGQFLFSHDWQGAIDFYGLATCQQWFSYVAPDPTATLVVNSISGPSPYPWTFAGQFIGTLPNSYTVSVTRTNRGVVSTSDLHVGWNGKLVLLIPCRGQ